MRRNRNEKHRVMRLRETLERVSGWVLVILLVGSFARQVEA